MGDVSSMVDSMTEIKFWQWFAGYGIKPNEDILEEERHAIFDKRVNEFAKSKTIN